MLIVQILSTLYLGKDDGFREWRENLKGVLKKTSLTINQNVLFLYDTQMTADDRYVEVIYINRTPRVGAAVGLLNN